jgi:hypothetical protein
VWFARIIYVVIVAIYVGSQSCILLLGLTLDGGHRELNTDITKHSDLLVDSNVDAKVSFVICVPMGGGNHHLPPCRRRGSDMSKVR